MRAHVFLDMLLSQVFDKGEMSLNDHSVEVRIKHAIAMTKQGIDDKFSASSVEFVRTLLEQQLGNQICRNIEVENYKHFSAVRLKDSTRFQLPANLKEAYPGSGGSASEAGVHIQFEFDLLSGKVADLHVSDALHQDCTDALETVEQVQAGSLVLRDLGYFDMDALEQMDKKGAYYISRLKSKVKIYVLSQDTYHLLDIRVVKGAMQRQGLRYQELNVYIGEQKKLPVRLVVECMPQWEVDKRLQKANREARKKGRTLSEQYKTYASVNLFVSNVPAMWLATPQLHATYRLRWQIELRFKIWKSYLHIHAVKKMKQHRFETYLYATLLFIMLHWEITTGLLAIAHSHAGKMLSIIKCSKALVLTCIQLQEALFHSVEKLQSYLQMLYEAGIDRLLLEKRKGHLSQEEILFQAEFCMVFFDN